MESNIKSLKDYVNVLARRKWQILITAVVLMPIGVALAFLLPPVYQSSATILIEAQGIPADLVRSTVTSYADERIQVITQRVMTRANLTRIIEKFDLYAGERAKEPLEAVLKRMRDSVKLTTVSAPTGERGGEVTIAFTLSFEGPSATMVQQVASELASLYLNENIRSRREQAAEASSFLNDEAQRLASQVTTLEQALAEFKRKHAASLPELNDLNLQMLERTDRELLEIDRAVGVLQERKVLLQAEIAKAAAAPAVPADAAALSPAEQLRKLETAYLSARAVYSPEHPDVQRLRREIDSLRVETAASDTRAALENRHSAALQSLEAARAKYSPDHPDVTSLEREVAALEASLAQLPAEQPASARSATQGSVVDSLLITLGTQLQTVELELAARQGQRELLKAKLAAYESRMRAAPEVEREFRALSRDYDNALAKYRDIKAKQMEAEVAQQLEQERKAERFTLIEPPQAPAQPIRPNRQAILLLGIVLSAAAGLGLAFVAEALDGRVHGADSVRRVFRESPLGMIPYLENRADRRRRRLRIGVTASVVIAAITVALLALHYLWMPLDVAWLSVERRLAGLAVGGV